jgi:superfamily II DNA or RNA helicase
MSEQEELNKLNEREFAKKELIKDTTENADTHEITEEERAATGSLIPTVGLNNLTEMMDLNVNGKIFPLWVMKNFKEFKLPEILRMPGENVCNISEKKELNKYQTFFGNFIGANSQFNEILVYHGLGTGKTASTIHAINIMYNISPDFNVIVLLKAALRQSWLDEMTKWIHRDKNETNKKVTELKILSHIHFVNYDSFKADVDFMEIIKKLDMRRKNMFVIEEAHNFIRNVYSNINSSEGKKAQTIYDYIIREKKDRRDTKIVLLTGTPIINEPFELALMFNMLRPGIFPSSEMKFEEIFITKSAYPILNPNSKNLFQRRILGLVSYYDAATPDKYAKKELHMINLAMSQYQMGIYGVFEQFEEAISQKNKFRKFKIKLYRTYTRQACNFVFPYVNETVSGEVRPRPNKFKISDKVVESYEKGRFEKPKNNIDLNAYLDTLKKFIEGTRAHFQSIMKEDENKNHTIFDDLEAFKKFTINNSDPKKMWFKKFLKETKSKSKLLQEFYDCGPKIICILFMSHLSQGPVLIYSNYVMMEGIEIIKIYLEMIGIKHYKNANDFKGYGEFHGLISREDRIKFQAEFNRKENMHGKIIKYFLLSPSGAEGLNLLHIRQIHILEPYWTEVRIMQVIGRGVRQCSHANLPPEERLVDIFRYKVVKSKKMFEENKSTENLIKVTADEIVEDNAKNKDNLNESFLSAMKEAAIDCNLFKNHNMINRTYQCFQFNEKTYLSNVSAPAFKFDIQDDLKYDDGLNALNSNVVKIKVLKIKAVTRTSKGFSSEENYWYNPKSGVVYDFELHYPVGVVNLKGGIPDKLSQDVYIMSDQIQIPSR